MSASRHVALHNAFGWLKVCDFMAWGLSQFLPYVQCHCQLLFALRMHAPTHMHACATCTE
jgi:hypothetical protein